MHPVAGLDLTAIGSILMTGGALVILLSLLVFMPRIRRRARSTAVTTVSRGRQAVTRTR